MNLDTLARETPVAELPKLAGLLAEAQAIVLARLTTPTVAAGEPETDWITPEECAAILKSTPDAIRRMAALRPYRSKLTPKKILYSRAGVLRLLKRRAA